MLIVAAVAATTLAVALLGGLVAFSPKLSEHLLAWSLLNLFITCVAEEVVFRGFIQRKAQRWFEAKQWPSIFVEPLVGSHPATFLSMWRTWKDYEVRPVLHFANYAKPR